MFGKVGFSHGAQIACFRFQFSLMCCHNTKACRRIIEVKFPELVSPPKVVNEEFNDSLNLPGACSLRFILRAHDVYERQSFYHRIGDNIFNQSKRHIFKHPSTQNDSTMAKPKKCWWMRKMTGSNVTNNQHYVRCLGRYPMDTIHPSSTTHLSELTAQAEMKLTKEHFYLYSQLQLLWKSRTRLLTQLNHSRTICWPVLFESPLSTAFLSVAVAAHNNFPRSAELYTSALFGLVCCLFSFSLVYKSDFVYTSTWQPYFSAPFSFFYCFRLRVLRLHQRWQQKDHNLHRFASSNCQISCMEVLSACHFQCFYCSKTFQAAPTLVRMHITHRNKWTISRNFEAQAICKENSA